MYLFYHLLNLFPTQLAARRLWGGLIELTLKRLIVVEIVCCVVEIVDLCAYYFVFQKRKIEQAATYLFAKPQFGYKNATAIFFSFLMGRAEWEETTSRKIHRNGKCGLPLCKSE